MHPNLEADFRQQQTLLLRLIQERHELVNGAPAANEVDRNIAKARDLMRSYRTIKWYERN
jgi:hypothetical protein